MSKKCRSKGPLHPFPYLINGHVNTHAHDISPIGPSSLSPKQQDLMHLIKQGARVLFDIKAKRALVYTWNRGFQAIEEITVRFLASLLRAGQIMRVGQDQNLVHFARAGADPSWYLPEKHPLC